MPTIPPTSSNTDDDLTDLTDLSQVSDEALLRAVRAGNVQAYGEIYKRYEYEARRYARSLVPLVAVDDVVADAFARILGATNEATGRSTIPPAT